MISCFHEEKKKHIKNALSGTIRQGINENCYGVDWGRGTFPLFSSPPRSIWQLKCPSLPKLAIQVKKMLMPGGGAGRSWIWLMHKWSRNQLRNNTHFRHHTDEQLRQRYFEQQQLDVSPHWSDRRIIQGNMLRQTLSKGHIYTNPRPGQYLMQSHIIGAVAAMDSWFALIGAHQQGIAVGSINGGTHVSKTATATPPPHIDNLGI